MSDRRHGLGWRPPLREARLRLDPLAVEVHGQQPGTASYNDNFSSRCYQPLVLQWRRADFLPTRLRASNANAADGAMDVALRAIPWARERVHRLWLRVGAGFPWAPFLDSGEIQGIRYLARVRTTAVLQRKAVPYRTHPPVGRPPTDGRTWTHELTYRTRTWSWEQRVVLVVTEWPGGQGRLFLDHLFLFINAFTEEVPGEEVLERYRRWERAEKAFADWTSGLELRRCSSPRSKTHLRDHRLKDPQSRCGNVAVNAAWLTLNLLVAHLLELARSLYRRAT